MQILVFKAIRKVAILTAIFITDQTAFGDLEPPLPPFPIPLLTLSVPFSYQQPTSPYITHTKSDIW